MSDDKKLLTARSALPDALHAAADQNWSAALEALHDVTDALVLARGYGFPIAQEVALKLKETMGMHAEAFSGAEVLHGPFAVIKKNFPALMFAQADASLEGMIALSQKIHAIGGTTLFAAPHDSILHQSNIASAILPLPNSIHPVCDPLMCVQAFYPMAAQLAVARGKNPDAPDNLQKVTETR